MKAKVTGIIKDNPSKHGNKFAYIFFKDEEGNSYKTCIYENCHNKDNWKYILDNPDKEIWLYNLIVKEKGLIDADSLPKLLHEPKLEEQASNWELAKANIKQCRAILSKGLENETNQ